jgi:hypothetical protein
VVSHKGGKVDVAGVPRGQQRGRRSLQARNGVSRRTPRRLADTLLSCGVRSRGFE